MKPINRLMLDQGKVQPYKRDIMKRRLKRVPGNHFLADNPRKIKSGGFGLFDSTDFDVMKDN
ncbi:MAG: hypothetical protein KME33_12225 [Aetokthonos hydrillicola CCALA 1050]|nr:hypothetical protein [Aetokthonos hydrillicola CCALA 1050]